ncbi:hypothetical protein LIER_20712 [Lithospermum erythrorhizon]|uniref:Uncharacterized protein n=1 Tax=Lithospermum erythrorhizon TaxID=34254 RepID=A0AAV3QPX9_LITER
MHHFLEKKNTKKIPKESLKTMALGVIKAAIADGLITFMWVFCASTFGILTTLIASILGVDDYGTNLLITAFVVLTFLFIFGFIGDALGGASFNPTDTAVFYAAGVGSNSHSLVSAAVRFPAQAAGAVGGALAILEIMPTEYKPMLKLAGPSLKVDLHTGAMAEGVLTFVVTLAVLFILFRGPRSPLVKNWLVAMSIVASCVTGAQYTGPSMNPAHAFGWAYISNKHVTWEQFYVYWICPFVGATLAAWVFRYIFPPSRKSRKGMARRRKSKKA